MANPIKEMLGPDGHNLRLKMEKRLLSLAEMPLALADTRLGHKVGAIGTLREVVAERVRDLEHQLHDEGSVAPVYDVTPEEKAAPPEVAPEGVTPEVITAEVLEATPPEVVPADVSEVAPPETSTPPEVSPFEVEVSAEVISNEAPAVAPIPEVVSMSAEVAPSVDLTRVEPVPGYDKLNVHKITAIIRETTDDALLDHILTYEEANRCRRTILQVVERRRDIQGD